jgi:uncharacterized YigZ family protein
MQPYPVPAEPIRQEIMVANSRFIADLAPAFTVEEARAYIAQIRQEFADATHHVPAYLIGHGASETAHCSDAGEPSGTAGRPALAVLQGSGLGDCVLIITRYFGGTKLGTGGLVRAYSDAARAVVNTVPRARRILTHTVMAAFPYTYLERIRRQASAQGGQILDEAFTVDVTLTIRLAVENFDGFQHDLRELTNGQIKAEIIETSPILMRIS